MLIAKPKLTVQRDKFINNSFATTIVLNNANVQQKYVGTYYRIRKTVILKKVSCQCI
jgi:hypothetical protein